MSPSETMNQASAAPLAPEACTLPTVEQPLRLAEWDALFAEAVTTGAADSATRLRLGLTPTPEVAARAASLVVRESQCCSFFTFTLTAGSDLLLLEVTVPPEHTEVLQALASRAAAGMGSIR